jgi:transposase
MISTWVKRFKEGGIEALENKRKPGNPLSKYMNKKELTPLEALQYENMKLRIENERLKKGYTTEEVKAY